MMSRAAASTDSQVAPTTADATDAAWASFRTA